MQNRRKILILLLVVTSMVALASAVRGWLAARWPVTNGVIFTDSYRLLETYQESLAVVADVALLGSDSHVLGDAALMSEGRAQVDGRIDGNLTMVGDSLTLGESGRVQGDLSIMGDQITIGGAVAGRLTVIGGTLLLQPRAQIGGNIVACVDSITDERPNAQPIQPCADETALLALFTPFQALSSGFHLSHWAASAGLSGGGLWFSTASSMLLTGLSALAVMIFPRQFSHMQEAIVTRPRSLAALGCMALLLALGLSMGALTLLAVVPPLGLILAPVGLLLGLSLLVMLVTGWITLALILGDAALRHLTRTLLPPVIAVALGSLLLFVLWHLLAILPFGGVIGLLLMGVLGSAGLGGALATRMGTRSLRQRYFVQG